MAKTAQDRFDAILATVDGDELLKRALTSAFELGKNSVYEGHYVLTPAELSKAVADASKTIAGKLYPKRCN